MATELVIYQMDDVERIARALAVSKLFGVQTPEQAIALCLIAQAEGRHPASAAADYDIIQGRPSKKSQAMLRDFLANGGKVEWRESTDDVADATFSHPAGGALPVKWDMSRAANAGLSGKDMWKKYPRQMLRARCIAEGVRAVFPMATSGMYEPGEVEDFTSDRADTARNVTPPKATPIRDAIAAPIADDPFADDAPTFDADDLRAWADIFEEMIDNASGPYMPVKEAFEAKTGEPQWAALKVSDPEVASALHKKAGAKVKALRAASVAA